MSVGKRHRDIIPTGCLAGYQKRPRTDRRRALDLDQVRSLVNAASFAAAQGRSLNALLTITWGATKQFSDQNWNVIQTQMFDKLSRFLKRRGVPTAFVWTRERVPGIGAHTHVLLHLGPQAETLKPLVLAYLTNIYNFSRNGVDISMGKFGANTAASQAGLLRYIAKGIDHRAFRYIGMDGETENIGVALGVRHRGQQGIVQIKRAGTSQSIGSAARRQAGWMEIRDLVALNRALNPGGRDAAEDG